MDLSESREKYIEKAKRHPWELARVEVIKKVIKRELGGSKKGIIVDIGCGDAFLLNELAEEFKDVNFIGVDSALDEKQILLLEKNLKKANVKLYTSISTISEIVEPSTVRLVLLLDVLEHIKNDIEFLSNLKNELWFSNQTKIIITVPAYNVLFCSHDKILKHYRRYSRGLMEDLLKVVNLDLIKTTNLFCILLLPRILQKISEKLFAERKCSETDISNWGAPRLLTVVLVFILKLDFFILYNLSKIGLTLPGLSILCVCQKPQ